MQSTVTALTKRRITSAVGVVIEGVDLRQSLSPETSAYIRGALYEHGVVFFRHQDLTNEKMAAFVANFGTPTQEPFLAEMRQEAKPVEQSNFARTRRSTAVWHTDTTFVACPPGLTALRAVKLPPVGGDTCWASMYAAYEALSEPMRRMLDGLTAVHSEAATVHRLGMAGYRGSGVEPEITHPVIRVHPETGRRALYISEAGMTRIVELEPAESAHILALLFEHVKSPDFSMRWCWQPNDVALWDNRSVQHYAVPDYDSDRIMQRVVLAGERPQGPRAADK